MVEPICAYVTHYAKMTFPGYGGERQTPLTSRTTSLPEYPGERYSHHVFGGGDTLRKRWRWLYSAVIKNRRAVW